MSVGQDRQVDYLPISRADAQPFTLLTTFGGGQSLLNETDFVHPRDFRWNNPQYECGLFRFGRHFCVPGWR